MPQSAHPDMRSDAGKLRGQMATPTTIGLTPITNFCNKVTRPTGQNGWSYTSTYDNGTPDEHNFLVSLADASTLLVKNECIASLDRIINSCDGNDPGNPLEKFGNEWVRSEYIHC
ncbi:hypothetical protein BJ170DRAFT_645819 [Xylariales sp. AK1849]|nr:hypothetical protein BJ170DRAFT_645819 [Xylariales sp. AK1849]